jgi:hypothetical protein
LTWAQNKGMGDLKKVSGKKTSKLTGIAKLDDANQAGGRKAADCTLILTEGDSAKTLAVSGLSVVGRDYYGVFPLKYVPQKLFVVLCINIEPLGVNCSTYETLPMRQSRRTKKLLR